MTDTCPPDAGSRWREKLTLPSTTCPSVAVNVHGTKPESADTVSIVKPPEMAVAVHPEGVPIDTVPPMDAPATAYVLEQSIESEQVDP